MRHRTLVTLVVALLVVGGAACASSKKGTAATTTTTAVGASSSTGASGLAVGLNLALPAPSDTSEGFARQDALTIDAAGNPVIAYVTTPTDDTAPPMLSVVTFDATTSTWRPPVRIADMTPYSSRGSLSAAFDPATKTDLIAYEVDGGIGIAQSVDGGATWTTSVAVPGTPDDSSTHPSIAAAGGKAVVAYGNGGGLEARTITLGPTTAVGDAVAVPGDGGNPALVRGTDPVSVATDGASFSLAYFSSIPTDAYTAEILYWPLGAAVPVKVTDSAGVQNDGPSLGLAFTGANPLIGASISIDEGTSEYLVESIASADGGKTFAEPVQVVPDGGSGPGFATAVAAHDTSAAIAYSSNSGDGTNKCGDPKLAVSSDLKTWETCSPDVDNKKAFRSNDPALAVPPHGPLFMAFTASATADDAPGIYHFVFAAA